MKNTTKQESIVKKIKRESKGKGIKFNLKDDYEEWLHESKSKKNIRSIKNVKEKNTDNIMIIDSGGGLSPTITKTAWKILSRTERKKSIPRISRSRCPKNMSSSECCNQSISKRL